MTGSGEAGLCIGLLEEAIMVNIPAIVVDPKGNISNLQLTFPEFRGEDFRRWINEDDARKKEATPDGFADKTAKVWEWMPINSATRAMKQRQLVRIAKNMLGNYERDL
ncbi:MAG: hypothetical protein L7T84_02730 [Akkermansiaceae bacterium]|nr:hypothetical protein [Akkermansiaceae bacterium]